ncbi:MAG TPA: hypothetical protein VNX40_11315 [Mucilaginibacter sp.]|nr:hypothetical protein [Mucilaginibacter sp.]
METSNKIINLSLNGIKYGTLLPVMDVNKLYQKLYSYNTIPIPLGQRSARWDHHSIFPVNSHYADAAKLLEAYWIPESAGDDTGYWLSWKPKKTTVRGINPDACTFKLYISPHIDDYFPVFAEVIKVLTEAKVYCFKTGSNYHCILRPDKLVVYFDNFSELKSTAEKIHHRTSNFSAQGVPFSAPLFDTLMLSWGIDPPSRKKAPVSWRVWITKELASGIIEGKKMLVDEPWQYALQHVRSRGFKIETWEPDQQLFATHQTKKTYLL